MFRRLRRFVLAGMMSVSIHGATPSARADDVADEADLHFRLAAEGYQRGDFRAALQHFLMSQRLVPNRNVVFNIARTYEKLAQYPEAFRYYTMALVGEPDATQRERIQTELDRIRPRVAVLDIETDPPGATLYVDRRDLGPRGESPRELGLPPGAYKILAELDGHEPAEVTLPEARAGQKVPVRLVLRPILGTARVGEALTGAAVRVGTEPAPRCTAPCDLSLPPGRYVLTLEREGHRPSQTTVDVLARQTVDVAARLEPLTGSVVVSTDEPGALIEVDGRSRGFSPTILSLPVGRHRVTISMRGFRSIERDVLVAADQQIRLEEVLTQSEEVTAASRVSEAVEDAPSSVTIIPRQELEAFAYPTIADALRGVRGMYLWDDRSYVSAGIRGIGVLGSYGNRQLVLADGHPTNDNWIGSSYIGFDARTDLRDLERIEVVRGPGSVLYGTNAFAGVVNLVTRYRDEKPGVEVGASAVDSSVGRGRVRVQADLGEGAGIWTSVAGAHGAGRDFRFPEYAAEAPPEGFSRDADGFSAGTVQGRVWWEWLTVQWFGHTHDKRMPTGAYETLLGDPRASQRDTRWFLEARAEPRISKAVQLLSRVHVNRYTFEGNYPRAVVDEGLEVDTFTGNWVGVEQRVVIEPIESLRLTAGAEGQLHVTVDQAGSTEAGLFLDETGGAGHPYRVGALYANGDVTPVEDVRISAGVRLDAYSFDRGAESGTVENSSVNPRAAVIVRPYARGNTKLLGGKAFRVPSIYELFYNDGGFTQVASPELGPESIYSLELEHSHRFSPTVTGLVTTFVNYATDLIVGRGAGEEEDPLRYENSPSPLASVGAELALRREWRQGWMLQASYGLVHARFLESARFDALLALRQDPETRNVSNYPSHVGSVKGAVPIIGRHLTAASRLTVESARYDRFVASDDSPQGRTDPFAIWDVILSGREDRWGLGYALGVYNAMGWRYALPVSAEFRQRTIPQTGRTFLASAEVAF
jgi:outer membrane receptor protein involved in Fe transport